MKDKMEHTAPIEHLVRHTLHKGRTTAELVKLLRYRRRKPKVWTCELHQMPNCSICVPIGSSRELPAPEPANAAQFDAVAAEVDE